MDASSVRAMVKRARFAFTKLLPPERPHPVVGGRAVFVAFPKIPGFASPPRDGFALDDR
jgi:hypothetical protein